MALTKKQIRFVHEMALDDGRSASKCAISAGYAAGCASEMASLNANNPIVISAIEERRAQLAAMAGVDAAFIVRELFAIASVDHRKITQTRIGCCRFCYGIDHKYQWTAGQYQRELNAAMTDGREAPELLGGFGYLKTRLPIADCPECAGEGVERVWVADSRDLDDATAKAYLGTKKTKDGLEVLKADKMKALELLGRYVGMWNDKMAVSAPGGGPVQVAHLHAVVDPKELTDAQLEAFLLENGVAGGNLGVPAGVSPEPVTIDATL